MTRRLSLIGPPLWHLQTLAAVAEEEKDEEEEGEEEEEEEGGCNREFRDIGRRNDCRSCPFFSLFPFLLLSEGGVRATTNTGGAAAQTNQIWDVNNRLRGEK